MQPRRGTTFAAVLVCAVSAGTMESSSGKEMATPRPCSIVRRDRCFLVTIVIVDVSSSKQSCGLYGRTGRVRRGLDLHPERGTLYDASHQIRKTVMVRGG